MQTRMGPNANASLGVGVVTKARCTTMLRLDTYLYLAVDHLGCSIVFPTVEILSQDHDGAQLHRFNGKPSYNNPLHSSNSSTDLDMDPLGCIIPLHNPEGLSAMEVSAPTICRRLLRLLRLVLLDCPLRSHHMSAATVLSCAGILKSGHIGSTYAVATTAG